MALDFAVIIQVRQRFGDDESEDIGLETQAPLVGLHKEFAFQCPNVDPNEVAILLFQSQGVSRRQALEINGQAIAGGIPSSTDLAVLPSLPPTEIHLARWIGNVMLVRPGVLRESNVLRIQAGEIANTDNVDNFIIDNMVVVFKTMQQ
jgi:hypothetical protein